MKQLKTVTSEQLAHAMVNKYAKDIYQLKSKPKLSEDELKKLKRLTDIAATLNQVRG
jgi:hypothetical protein